MDNDIFKRLLKEPHLLIAGATGTGKSVLINGLICNLLESGPEKIKLVLVDPKMVELYEYRHLPQVLAYADNVNSACDALEMVIKTMERRFIAMRASGVKSYSGAQIYVIIDEYADLVLTAKKRIAPLVQRILQLARAAGIHVILATQSPLATILSTDIKCNMPSRIALKTATARDSRNIIDVSGAELLPPYGMGIFRHGASFEKIEIPYISDSERKQVIFRWNNIQIYKRA